jgi:hypothetical protein
MSPAPEAESKLNIVDHPVPTHNDAGEAVTELNSQDNKKKRSWRHPFGGGGEQ